MTAKIHRSNRLHVVDGLRGFAIVAIMLLHNIEHFDLYFTPENIPAWMEELDSIIWGVLFFLFAGKAYSIFAILFGLTYHIQTLNQQKRGKDFRLRFLWRMLLLFGFGIINSAFFQGDILTLYAIIGILLVPFTRVSNSIILIIITLIVIQPLAWIQLIQVLDDPNLNKSDPASWIYFGKSYEYLTADSFVNTLEGNLTNGKKAVLLWNWENGRLFMLLALFLLGYLLGKMNTFYHNERSKNFWKRILKISLLIFLPLFFIRQNIGSWLVTKSFAKILETIFDSWSNLAFTFVLISSFYILFHHPGWSKLFNYFNAFGKMSLSNYIFQSILGSFIYYGFGLGLYQYTSATYSLLIGIALVLILGVFCHWWARNFKRGPLETIWHRLTWIF